MNINEMEHKFVFRISRGLFLFFASLVSLALVCAIVVFFYSFSPSLKGSEPDKPTPPPAPQITAEEINGIIASQAPIAKPEPVESKQVEEDYTPASTAGLSPREQVDMLMEEIHTSYFPEEGSLWQSGRGKKSVKDRLEWGMVYIDDQTKIIFLKTVLQFLQGVSTELRYNTIQSLSDICRAYRSDVPQVYGALNNLFSGKLSQAADGRVNPLPDDQRLAILDFIFEIRKRKTPADTFVVAINHWNNLSNIFGAAYLEKNMLAMWNSIEGMEPGQAEEILASYEKILPQITPENHVQAMYIYRDLLNSKTSDQQRIYEEGMAEYRSQMLEREMKYDAKVVMKKNLRKITLSAIMSTIGAIAFLGLLLALLGIERNTRTLQALLDNMARENRK